MLRLVLQRIDQCTEPNWPAADEDNRLLGDLLLSGVLECIPRREVASREDIRHEDEVLLVDALRGFND